MRRCRRAPPSPPPRTKWTRRVPHPVLIGRDAAVQARDEAETARAIAEALAAQAEEARAAHNEAMEKRMIEARHPTCHPTPPPAACRLAETRRP